MKRILCSLAAMLMAAALSANNIQISNVTLTGDNPTGKYVLVQFDLSWDNSWRVSSGPSNWDAAWIFIKYRLKNETLWHHATLHYVDGTGSGDGHIPASGAMIASSNDNSAGGAYGVFIYHDAPISQGSVSYPATALRWDYGVDGVASSDSVSDLEAFGIEMVYVPQGSFQVGTGGTSEKDGFYTYPDVTQPYMISSEDAIPVGTTNGDLYYQATGSYAGDQSGPIPAAFPKGYQAFYVMKYEITQEQYAAFLNTLTPNQSDTRYFTVGHGYRNGANGSVYSYRTKIQSSVDPANPTQPYFSPNPYVPCGFMEFEDVAAYCDWAGLRPLSELEYEKACRGPVAPVKGEFAWGTTAIDSLRYSLSNPGVPDESISANYGNAGNAVWSATFPFTTGAYGPVRSGIFAANPSNAGRATAGASYYGIMELTGNEWEAVISVGEPPARSFNGRPGDGVLDSNGYSNEGWPYFNDPAYPTMAGAGFRGGGFVTLNDKSSHMVSDRSLATRMFIPDPPQADCGGRGARTAP